ncbi:MAG: hypothetical protein GY818_21125 [Planctomycetaceae bacterium]|nr:hypothetical protein [Planctomycetaceae bacterium]
MSNRPKPRLSSIGDPMSELNIQRRLQWLRECNPAGIIRFPKDWVDEDPALQRAIEELDYVQLERPRVLR